MSPRPISIWRPHIENGELLFVRPDPHSLGDHYAANRVIRAQKLPGSRRICFFGESVAAGYGFAPYLTPAQVLEHQLTHRMGHRAYEVVDLARTNETLAGLLDTVEASFQLAPDMLVLFAGNNWNLLETPHVSAYAQSPAARHAFGARLREGGLWNPINHAARERLERVGAALSTVRALAVNAAIPVVLVIPEVNLLDWETRQPVSWLATTEVTSWYRWLQEGESALIREEWGTAVERAHQMLALDDGTCPTGYRLLARARIGQGQIEEARAAARAEVDSVYFPALGFLAAPQTTTFDQELMRRLGRAWGWDVTDLPALFAQYPGRLEPDHSLFLDYCHLTEEGIRIAMGAVARATLRRFDGDPGSEISILDSGAFPLPPLAAEDRATAFLGTALHSAHRLAAARSRKAEILEHWCIAALDTAPEVEGAMLNLVTARLTGLPSLLTRVQEANLESPFRLQFQHGWEYGYLDAAILQAIERVLSQRRRPMLSRSHAQRHPMITHPFFELAEPLQQLYPDLLTQDERDERAFLRAAWPRTTFALITDLTVDHLLDITLRLPVLPGQFERPGQTVRVRLNGDPIGSIRAGSGWRRAQLVLPSRRLRRGINRLTLNWPALPPFDATLSQEVAKRLREGDEADLHPTFGEIYDLVIQPAS